MNKITQLLDEASELIKAGKPESIIFQKYLQAADLVNKLAPYANIILELNPYYKDSEKISHIFDELLKLYCHANNCECHD